MMKPLTVKGVTVENPVLLAPLAGVTDAAFRFMCRRFGAGLTCTEMVSAKGLLYDNRKTVELLVTAENERVKAVQLFGSDPVVLGQAVQHPDLQKFDLIDLNMGCPVPKIVGNGEGSALMKNLPLAGKVISACAKNTDKPVTVKFRKGFDDAHVNAVEFAKMCEDSGAAMLTVHGRTRAQMYSGKADWSVIERVVHAVQIPVIGNGDIFSATDAEEMVRQTGCAGVMVARGALGKPWIFAEILGNRKPLNLAEEVSLHVAKMTEFFPERYVLANIRKHVAWYVKGLPGAAAARERVNRCTELAELHDIIGGLNLEI